MVFSGTFSGAFSAVVGQGRAVALLERALASGKMHHGYLFEGPDGVGKATTARALAMALNCLADTTGCGRCDACLKIASHTHPDVVTVDMTPKGLTERMRDLIGTLGFRPHEGRARLLLFDPAHELGERRAEAANVLLKTLEEPPPATFFVLITAHAKRLPITIRSRLERIRFQPLGSESIARVLAEQLGAPADRAQRLAEDAEGSLGRALAALEEDGEEVRRSRLRELVRARGDLLTLFDVAATEGGDRDEALALCQLLEVTLRDALLCNAALDAGRVGTLRRQFADDLFGQRPLSSLLGALTDTRDATEALLGHVAPPLVLEHLMLTLRQRMMAA